MFKQRFDSPPIPSNRVEQRQTLCRMNAAYVWTYEEAPVRPALQRAKKESLVRDNRSSQRSADLVLQTERRRPNELLVEIAARIQMIVVVKNESRTVQPIRSAPGDHIDHPSRSAAILCCKLIRDDPELSNNIGIVNALGQAGQDVEIAVLAVDHEIGRTDSHSVDRNGNAAFRVQLGVLTTLQLCHASHRQRQVDNASVRGQRQFRDSARVEVNSDFGVRAVDGRSVRNNFDLGGNTSYLQANPQICDLVQPHDYRPLDVP